MGQENDLLASIARCFHTDGEVDRIERIGDGHIHDSYRCTTEHGSGYVLQRINTDVFRDPVGVMRNIVLVLESVGGSAAQTTRGHGIGVPELVPPVRGAAAWETDATAASAADGRQLVASGEHSDLPVLRIRPDAAAAGEASVGRERTRPDGWWRMWREVAHARPAPAPAPPREARACGLGFGTFLELTAGIEPGRLSMTIPRFHDIERRLGELDAAVREDPSGRLGGAQREVGLVQERASAMRAWFRSLGRLPERVTHNDTKFNNILLDTTSGEPRAVIDLDTVMAGYAAYDFGDGARTGAVTAAEDTPHPEDMHLNVESFEAYTDGFLSVAALTRAERETLPGSTGYMTFIMGVRFLTDHIAGDRYYHVDEPGHNLRRARAQLALVLDLERRTAEIAEALV